MTTLDQTLDKIWKDSAPRRASAAKALVTMNDEAILGMLAHLLVAEAGEWLIVEHRDPLSLFLRYRGATAEASARLGNGFAANAIVHLTDINRELVVNDDGFAQMWGPVHEYNASSILAAQQFSRDHIDSFLYLPPEMRKTRLDEVSAELGVPVELLLKFAIPLGGSASH